MNITITLEQEQAEALLELISAKLNRPPSLSGQSSGNARANRARDIELRNARSRIRDAFRVNDMTPRG